MNPIAVKVQIPDLLLHCTEGKKQVEVAGETVQGCLDRLLETWPLLKVHLFDEAGRLRPHVLIFYNDENTRWLKHLDTPVRTGDRITLLQSVSGG